MVNLKTTRHMINGHLGKLAANELAVVPICSRCVDESGIIRLHIN